MYEKPKEKHGFSRVREGPGAQVGATWAQKSRPKGVRTGKRCLGQGRRRGQDCYLEVLGETLSQKSLFLEMYEDIRKSMVFQGLERVRAPKLEPLGSKSRAQRGSGRAKGASDRAAGGVRTIIWRSSG